MRVSCCLSMSMRLCVYELLCLCVYVSMYNLSGRTVCGPAKTGRKTHA